ncbi:hypothetical protein Pla8534_30030 [Lignipirellula cremea]|uniref:Uncharacterized protein n=1 Tax=Lignipirellula cremea TaxID=2528010 RepID=A0A518DTM8_9BACT|nr:hypothetical protein Pla8534_30030 [Lignipirellula cremea]
MLDLELIFAPDKAAPPLGDSPTNDLAPSPSVDDLASEPCADVNEADAETREERIAIAQEGGDCDPVLAFDSSDAGAVWQAALDHLDGDPRFPPDLMDSLRTADARWADVPEGDDWGELIEVIDPPDPCPNCGTLERWQSLAGNWRCMRCDPPAVALRLRERAEVIRRQIKP